MKKVKVKVTVISKLKVVYVYLSFSQSPLQSNLVSANVTALVKPCLQYCVMWNCLWHQADQNQNDLNGGPDDAKNPLQKVIFVLVKISLWRANASKAEIYQHDVYCAFHLIITIIIILTIIVIIIMGKRREWYLGSRDWVLPSLVFLLTGSDSHWSWSWWWWGWWEYNDLWESWPSSSTS